MENTQKERASFPVALVSMPFVSISQPSIQLGLLKAEVEAYGFPITTFHLNLDFARQIGIELYETLCRHRGLMLGDWLFSLAAFGNDSPDPEDQFLDAFYDKLSGILECTGQTVERLASIRHDEVPRYLDTLQNDIAWEDFRVVGFSSTFQQNVASFALAKRLKNRFPHVCCIFGGANFEEDMGVELTRSILCVDYAVTGEGDRVFPELLASLAQGEKPPSGAGVVSKSGINNRQLKPPPLIDEMDSLPVPDYREYFQRADQLCTPPKAEHPMVEIPFESSRGCWWGAKNHCTFCGLNGSSMKFRSKSPDHLIQELAILSERHGTSRFGAVDNILDFSYLKTVLAQLISEGSKYDLFYEIKSNLTREQIRTLAMGGVSAIQPGIESLNSNVLSLMRKGVTGIQNVNTLRWVHYYGIDVTWSLLWGFPGEANHHYEEQLKLMRKLTHLPPPKGAGRIWMERFSPIYFDRDSFPAKTIKPEASYAYVYPSRVDLNSIAYFFEYDLEDVLPPESYVETQEQVRAWQEAWKEPERPSLKFSFEGETLQITDRRNLAEASTHIFNYPYSALYSLCCDRPRSLSSLKKKLELNWPEVEIEKALGEFCDHNLMMSDVGLFLSLALPEDEEVSSYK